MANKLYNDTSIKAIADAIRAKNGKTDTYTVGEMAGAISSLSGKETVTWHQCPEAPRNFVNDVTYDPSDYSTSQIANYAPATPVASNTRPIGKTVGGVTYYNEVPNVETPFSADSAAGTLKPLDPLRWINAGADSQGYSFCPNMRDIGGWPCDGGKVRYGLLFRCGQPAIYARPVLVDQLHIQRELDLQGQDVTQTTSVMGTDIDYCRPPRYQWYTITDKTIWKEILAFLFEGARYGRPTIFHCAAGADRTGTVACIVEALLGVSQSNIDKDYELTSFDVVRKRTYASDNNAAGANWVGLINSINALPVGTTFRDKVINWVASMGFTVDEINAFRTAMIDGTPETITLDIGTCSVTSNLSNSLSDNSETSLAKYQPYSAVIVPKGWNVIKSIIVTMGGVDVTGKYVTKIFQPNGEINIDAEGKYGVSEYSMAKVAFPNYSITQTLGEATSNNTASTVTKNKGYGAIIKSNNGFKIKNITVTMGGVDITGNVTVGMEV